MRGATYSRLTRHPDAPTTGRKRSGYRQSVLHPRVPRRLRPGQHRPARPRGGRLDPGLPAGGHDVRRAERGQRQRHPDHHLVLGHAPDLARRLRRARARTRPRAVLHRRDQPDRQRPVDLAAQRRRPEREIAMSNFPKVRIGDDVVAQERLLREHFGIEQLAARGRRLDGRPADLRVGGPVPGQGAARRADRRHGAEHPARLPLHRGAQRADLVRPGLERRGVRVERRRRRRAQAARAHLGGDGLLDGVLEAGGLARAGVRRRRRSSSQASSSRTSP